MPLAKVMLVDDEQPFVEAMSRRLAKRDLKVCTAFGGTEALEKLRQEPDVDVVILDVKMPGMDGVETLREIKKGFPLVEVIMLTGHATVESAIEGMKLGAYDYLMKPCDMDQLMTKIAEATARKAEHEQKILEARMRQITLHMGS
ncbi:MAG: response regulator [Deltaproteobacteria bacterium]|nr:response regulator [Deltaproteobacteria bacterium]